MTRVSIIAECGHREQKGKIEGGECRDCRGVDRLKRPDTGGNRWGDSGEARAHRTQRQRARVINNRINQ